MVHIAVREVRGVWFAMAAAGHAFVATAVGESEPEAYEALMQCLPRRADARIFTEPTDLYDEASRLLAALHEGQSVTEGVTLSPNFLSPQLYRIYAIAASIPPGYVTTYGTLAVAARSEARPVGRAMATNPLYPIVPCHRVVGADFSMTGYGGRQDEGALDAKLGRLSAEQRGAPDATEVDTGSEPLTVYPVEWVLEASRENDERIARGRREAAAREEAAAMQLQLF